MDSKLLAVVERRVGAAVTSASPVAGGCISEASIVRFDNGESRFVKTNRLELSEMFEREAEGLAALEDAGALRVPAGAWAGTAGNRAFLAMEAIEAGSPGPGFWKEFGEGCARLHREARARRPGFPHDNFIGTTPQANEPCPTWTDFWRRRRLAPQLELSRRQGRSTAELDRLGDRLVDRLGEWLDDVTEEPSLLHGDLWSGNYLVDSDGAPAVIDPACYYGHREADLAMTRLFGGFPGGFYDAYEAAWPLDPGSGERLAVYQLYHVLNHLNLFGASYRGQCVELLRRLVG